MRAALAIAALAAAAVTPSVPGASAHAHHAVPPVPGRSWKHVTPRRAGLRPHALHHIAAVARTGHSNCLVVARHGRIAGEWYFRGTGPGTTQDVFSATKSITSTLVGIARDRGDLRLGDRASRWIPSWRHTPSARVTIRELLANDSGRQWSPALDYRGLITAPDRTAYAIGLGQDAAPGTVWAYNNSAIQTLERVLERATGQDVARFAQRRLFGPLGMRHTTMTRDASGAPQMFEGVRSNCRDMARFGTLMLDGGRWGRHRIVSRSWVRAATGAPSQRLNAAYGLLWWLNRKGHISVNPLVATSLPSGSSPAPLEGRIVPGAPAAMYWALGLGNQLVQVDPGSGTVVVRLGTAAPRPQPPTFGPAEASRVVTQAVVPGRR